MDTSIDIPRVGIAAEDVPDVAALARSDGPFVSVVTPTDRHDPNAVHRLESRWRAQREQLAGRGAPEAVLDAVSEAIQEARLEGDGLVVAANAVTSVTLATDDEVEPFATWDVLPVLCPFVASAQSTPPGVLAVVDRTGADLFATGSELPVEVVEGESGPVVRRSAPGGWSQRRFQQRAEMTWRNNAGTVAEQLQEVAQHIDARVVVLAGDDRAVKEVVEQLPVDLQHLVRHASGGRGEGSEGHLAEDVRRWYRTAVAEDSVALIHKFDEELGQRDRAVVGLEPTVHALGRAAVDTLLLHDAGLADRRLFVRRSEPATLAVREADLEGTDLIDAPAADALVVAAWATGARVRIVPSLPELTDGVGALLRFST